MTMFQTPKMATYPLDKFKAINCDTVSGSTLTLRGSSGSINFGDILAASAGGAVSNIYLKVNVTGSTYLITLLATA
jgi:hypothetical protein